MTQELEQLLSTHAHVIQPLLGDLWPVNPWKVEQFGPLTKYTLGPMEDGRWAMLHRLTEPDHGAPHDHPVAFTSIIIKGSYLERVYQNGTVQELLWEAGSSHDIAPDYIHTITELPEGECWSLCFAGPVVREWKHYPTLA
jgi:hypothetical protein